MILVLTFGLASLLSSPNIPAVTVKSWAQVDPGGFLATAATELNATSGSATLGPPYNNNGDAQRVLIAPGNWAGIRQPIDTAQVFVLGPLSSAAANDPALAAALATYKAAPGRPAEQVGGQLRERGPQGEVRQRQPGDAAG